MSLRLCSDAPRIAQLLVRRLAPDRRHRNRQLVAQVLGGQRARLVQQRVERAREDHPAALLPGAEPHVDDRVGDADHVGVVLDDEHGVALVAQLPQDGDQPLVVARVQADRRLVEHVERVDERRAERRREIDALRLAARQRRGQPIERQVVEPDVAQESQPLPDLAQHLVGDRGFLLRQRELGEKRVRIADRQAADDVDRAPADLDVARLAAQPRAAALRARQVAAIPAEEHANVHLVLLALEPAEEPLDPFEARAVAFDDEPLLVVGQLRPGHVEAHAARLRRALQLGELRAIVRLAPGLDRVLRDRLRWIRDDQRHVELDDVAEAVAERAGAERVVEREQPRLRQLVRDVALAALEPLAETERDRLGALALSAGSSIANAAPPPSVYAVSIESVSRARRSPSILTRSTITWSVAAILQRRRVHVLERDRLAVDVQPAEPLAAQRGERLGDRDRRGRADPAAARTSSGAFFRGGRFFVLRLGHARAAARAVTTGMSNPMSSRVPSGSSPRRRATTSAVSRITSRPQFRQIRAADARVEQPQVVVNLGRRPDRRARIADAVLLADGDRRADALDRVDVGLLHPLEELPRVGGQRFDVAALPFGVDRVERQRRLARPADARHDHQRTRRQRQVDVLEIVGPRAADDDLAAACLGCARHLLCRISGLYLRIPRNSPSTVRAAGPRLLSAISGNPEQSIVAQPANPSTSAATICAILLGLCRQGRRGSPAVLRAARTKRGLCQSVCL